MDEKNNSDEAPDNSPKEAVEDEYALLNEQPSLRRLFFWLGLMFIPLGLSLFAAALNGPSAVVEPVVAAVEEVAPDEAAEPNRRSARGDWSTEGRSVLERARGAARGGVASEQANIYKCEFSSLVGVRMTDVLEDKIKALGRPYRLIPPGYGVTTDFFPARINVDVDAHNMITRVWCG